MRRRPPGSTGTAPLFPPTTLFRSRKAAGDCRTAGRAGCLPRAWERLQPGALAPPPATAGGGREGVVTARADPEGTPPQPLRPASTAGVRSSAREPMVRKRTASPPAFAGEGAWLLPGPQVRQATHLPPGLGFLVVVPALGVAHAALGHGVLVDHAQVDLAGHVAVGQDLFAHVVVAGNADVLVALELHRRHRVGLAVFGLDQVPG